MFGVNFHKIEKSYWLLVVPILHMTVPWLQYRLRMLVPFLCMVMWLLVCNKRRRVCYSLGARYRMKGGYFFAFLMTVAVYFLRNFYALFGHGNFMAYFDFAAAIMSLTCLVILYVIVSGGKVNELRFLMLVEFFGIAVSAILSMIGASRGLEGARAIMSGKSAAASYDAVQMSYDAHVLGMGGYGFTYEMALIAGPALYGALKIRNKHMKFALFVACAACCVSVRNSGLGTPVFVLALNIGTALLSSWSRRRIWSILMSWSAVILLISFIFSSGSFMSFASKPLAVIAEGMKEGSIKSRVASVADALSGNQDSYAKSRYQLQRNSWKVFTEYPVFGVGHYSWPHPKTWDLGGHSFMFDRLGQQGLFGFMFVVLMLVGVWRYFKVLARAGFGSSWLVMEAMAMGCYVFAAIANPYNYLPTPMLLLIPGIATYLKDFRLGVPIIYSNRRTIAGGW